MDYIEAAKLRGEGTWYLITEEILPNATAPLLAEFGLRFCFVFLTIAGLSFLGLGIQPPLADWGSMVRDNAVHQFRRDHAADRGARSWRRARSRC
jgi:peptide/nickel transport system permease protein